LTTTCFESEPLENADGTRRAFAAKGFRKVLLITDSDIGAGLPDRDLVLKAQNVRVSKSSEGDAVAHR